MSKRKADQIAGHNLCDLEIEDWINHCGLHPNDARAWTILRWSQPTRERSCTSWRIQSNRAF
jgi:hypothetical protein